ncbi:MAG: pyridoxal phosphate-dependent aminotransferase [Lentisphaerae bacterium]|nr:pyridoxal phosphate-dependent aminotransferase [Lentisphaerota bacterium]
MQLNERIAAIPPSATLKITARAKQMVAEGRDVCSFAAGEPDFDTPEPIKRAAAEALAAGRTKYAPSPGLPELRGAIAAKLERENGLAYAPEQVVVSNGAKHSLFNIIMVICDVGDEVIIPAPYWLSYPEMVRVAGGTPVAVACAEDNDFKLTPDALAAAITPRTRALVVNSPSNPIGVVYTREELAALAEVAVAKHVLIIADEIYEKLVYDGTEYVSVGSLSDEVFEHVITVNGFSKAFAMTGWRLGYFAGPTEVVKAVNALQSHSTSGANTFAQCGALAALEMSDEDLAPMVAAFAERRGCLYDRLSAMDGVTCVKPMGAFYALPNISSFGLDSVTFARRLLEEHGVAAVPGAPFSADANIRLSYACSLDTINEGLDRLEAFIASL